MKFFLLSLVFEALVAVYSVDIVLNDHNLAFKSISSSFICATLDWWPNDKCDYGSCPWVNSGLLNLNISHPLLQNAIKELSTKNHPFTLRMGGSTADLIRYEVTDDDKAKCKDLNFKIDNNIRLGYSLNGTCVAMNRWDQLNKLCNLKDSNCQIAFGINALSGRIYNGCNPSVACHTVSPLPACCTAWSGEWSSENALTFLQYSKSKDYKLSALEYGNELAGDSGIQAKINATDYKSSFDKFASTVASVWTDPKERPLLVAVDSSFDETWLRAFLGLKPPVDVITVHAYTLGAGNDAKCSEKTTDYSSLDKLKSPSLALQKVISEITPANTQLWVGEAGGAYNSGSTGVTDAFISAFWYLDNMSVVAERGHSKFCRQTLVGGKYGLLSKDTFQPNPDYYAAVLWTRLMGSTVLSVTVSSEPKLRAYAHCHPSNSGDFTLLLLNLYNETTNSTIEVNLTSVDAGNTFSKLARTEYHMSASKSVHDSFVSLNDVELVVEDSKIPQLLGKSVVGGSILINPATYAFIVFQNAKLNICNKKIIVDNDDVYEK